MGGFNKHDLFQTFCDALGITTKHDLENTAYHEAGHAVANILLPCFLELKSATITSKNGAAGTTHRKPKKDIGIKTETTFKNEVLMLLAGDIAKEHHSKTTGQLNYVIKEEPTDLITEAQSHLKNIQKFFINLPLSPSSILKAAQDSLSSQNKTKIREDLNLAQDHAYFMIKTHGFPKDMQDPAKYPSINTSPLSQIFGITDPFSKAMDDRVNTIIKNETKNTRAFVAENWDAIDRVAQALLKHKTLSAEEIEKLVYQDNPKPDVTLS